MMHSGLPVDQSKPPIDVTAYTVFIRGPPRSRSSPARNWTIRAYDTMIDDVAIQPLKSGYLWTADTYTQARTQMTSKMPAKGPTVFSV